MRYGIFALSLAAFPLSAQQFTNPTTEFGLSTLGLYVGPSFEVMPDFRLRIPLYFGGLSRDFDLEGNNVNGEIDILSGGVVGDYYVDGGNFRLSAGLTYGGYEATANIDELEFDSFTYREDFKATLQQEDDIAPVFAIGYQRQVSSSGWGFMAELGVRVASLELILEGQENLPTQQLRDDFNAEINGINADLRDFDIIPFFAIGVSYSF